MNFVLIFSMICVAGLEGVAIIKGIDGKTLALAIGFFGGVCGYWVNKRKNGSNRKIKKKDHLPW